MSKTGLSSFKIIKSLEWCTELPTIEQPRKSPVFLLNGNEWFLLLNCKYACYLYIKLEKENTEVEPCPARLQIGFKNEDLSLCKEKISIKSDLKSHIWIMHLDKLQSKLPGNFIAMGNFMKIVLSFDGTHELRLKTSDGSDEESLKEPSFPDTNIMLESMSRDFSKLFDDGLNHDVEIICGDQTFKAHKRILCCRSDVFASMLQSEMIERKTGRITIQDMDAVMVQQFLKSLYSGKLEELTVDNAICLYKAGNLSSETFRDVLMLADLHNDVDFKKKVIEYIIMKKVPYCGEKWTDFCKEYPVLAIEVLNLFCQHLREK